MRKRKAVTAESVWREFEKGLSFNSQLNLYETVQANENFYIGKQWEGVQSNGLPTPVFNFIKRIILYVVASTAADNIKVSASPLSSSGVAVQTDLERIGSVINAQFEALFEQNKLGKLLRRFMRNAAVDGDSCIYSWFEPSVETGQTAKGAIRSEILENSRVLFGNPNTSDVQSQPYILVTRRELLEDVQDEAEAYEGTEPESIVPDSDETNSRFDSMSDGKVTTITRFWKNKETDTIWAIKTAHGAVIRKEWDTGMTLYPIVWMSWDYVTDCYHGQAAVTGLIPNQIFVNKMFAMTMISLMTTAYPKVVYDRTRIARWDSGVGKAIGVNGGDVAAVAKTIDPAVISPQVSQFIELAISLTKEFMGATDAALGDTRPDNTSAIIALQKASAVPMEMTKQDFFQSVEDLGRIWLDQMRNYYGARYVDLKPSEMEKQVAMLKGVSLPDRAIPTLFDFTKLETTPMSIKLDVGGSAYWSEIAQMNTLDNLLLNKEITIVDYLERVPAGYISNKEELLDALRQRMGMVQTQVNMLAAAGQQGGNEPLAPEAAKVQIPGGSGYGELQRSINETGVDGLNLSQIRT